MIDPCGYHAFASAMSRGDIRHPAPTLLGADRAGGPGYGHPALFERQREGLGVGSTHMLAKAGNGAPLSVEG